MTCDLNLTCGSIVTYKLHMIEVRKSDEFRAWMLGLTDQRAVARINGRLNRASLGNFGDVAPVGDGVSEFRIDYGPGYRVYFVQRGRLVVILLCGGDKSSQRRDIKKAKALAADLED